MALLGFCRRPFFNEVEASRLLVLLGLGGRMGSLSCKVVYSDPELFLLLACLFFHSKIATSVTFAYGS